MVIIAVVVNCSGLIVEVVAAGNNDTNYTNNSKHTTTTTNNNNNNNGCMKGAPRNFLRWSKPLWEAIGRDADNVLCNMCVYIYI